MAALLWRFGRGLAEFIVKVRSLKLVAHHNSW